MYTVPSKPIAGEDSMAAPVKYIPLTVPVVEKA
jgi:hypothetical protein